MQSNSEGRIVRLETILKWIQDRLRSLTNRVVALENAVRQMSGVQYNWGGGGSSGTEIFKCKSPSSGTWEATGTPLATTPDSFVSDIYTLDGSPTLVESDATVYYDSTTTLTANAVLLCKSNTDGTYSAINWVCNAS